MKRLFALIGVLLSILSSFGQDYYKDGDLITADGITYKVTRDKYGFELVNIENKQDTISTRHYKDGTRLKTLEEHYAIVSKPLMPNLIDWIIQESFTEEQIAPLRLKKGSMILEFWISPEGDTLEVTFSMDPIAELLSIPPERYALFEKNLKQHLKWKLSFTAQKMQCIYGGGFVFFKTAGNPRIEKPELPDRDPIIDDTPPFPIKSQTQLSE